MSNPWAPLSLAGIIFGPQSPIAADSNEFSAGSSVIQGPLSISTFLDSPKLRQLRFGETGGGVRRPVFLFPQGFFVSFQYGRSGAMPLTRVQMKLA